MTEIEYQTKATSKLINEIDLIKISLVVALYNYFRCNAIATLLSFPSGEIILLYSMCCVVNLMYPTMTHAH